MIKRGTMLGVALLLISTFGGPVGWAIPPTLLPTLVSFTVADFQPRINLAGPVRSIARNPSDIFEVFVASAYGGLWKSTDGGNNWTPVRSLPVHDLSVVVYHPDGSVLVSSREDFRSPANGAGVWRSDDHGDSWTQVAQVPSGCADRRAHGLAISPLDGSIYVATSCGLLVSRLGGEFRLIPVRDFPLGTPQQFYSVAFNRNAVVLVGGESGIYTRDDQTTTSSYLVPPTSGLMGTPMTGSNGEMRAAFAVSPSAGFPDFVVAVTGQTGSDAMIVSQDGGQSWAPVTTKPTSGAAGAGGSPFVRIVRKADGSEDLFVYYGNALGIFRAGPFTDGDLSTLVTASWTEITPLGHSDPHDLEFVHPPGSNLDHRTLFVSTDGGLEICSFSGTNDDVNCADSELGAARGLTSILAMNVKGQVIGSGEAAVRHLYLQTWHDNVWKSIDDGVNWNFFSSAEGSTLEMERRVASPEQVQITWDVCGACSNQFQDSPPTTGATFPDVPSAAAPPTMIRRGVFAQLANSPTSTTVSVAPNLFVTSVGTPGWVQLSSLASGTAPVTVPSGWAPVFGGYSGSGTPNPILYQPYQSGGGVALAVLAGFIAPPGTGVPTILPTTPTYPRMQWTDSFGVVQPGSLPVSPGITWTPFEGFFGTPVIGVDPRAPSHVLAPDTNNQRVMRTIPRIPGRIAGKAARWQPIPDLSAMVVRDAAGARRFAFSYNRGGFGAQSFVSAISFDPDDPNLVILGTVDNGLFFSMDNASSWRRIPGTEHIVNPLAFYWRSANSVVVASHGRGLFEVRMRFTLPPSSLGLICHGCRILTVGPPLFGAAVMPSQTTPKPQPSAAIQQSTFDEAVLVLDGRINGVDIVQGRLTNIWTTVGSSHLTFGGPNSTAKYTVEERSGFVGFKGLPEADLLRSQGEVVKGLVLSDGNVVAVIYGANETETPVSTVPGRAESPNEADPNPTDPGFTHPYLRLLQTRVGPGEPLVVQGYNFSPNVETVVLLDGTVIGKTLQLDANGRFVLNIPSPKSLGPHTLQVGQFVGNDRAEASVGFGVANTDDEQDASKRPDQPQH